MNKEIKKKSRVTASKNDIVSISSNKNIETTLSRVSYIKIIYISYVYLKYLLSIFICIYLYMYILYINILSYGQDISGISSKVM